MRPRIVFYEATWNKMRSEDIQITFEEVSQNEEKQQAIARKARRHRGGSFPTDTGCQRPQRRASPRPQRAQTGSKTPNSNGNGSQSRAVFLFLRNTVVVTLAEFDALYSSRHESDVLESCIRILEKAPSDESEWEWRHARLFHFRAMQTLEQGEEMGARTLFSTGQKHADVAQKIDASRVEGTFWSGTCELEAARLSGKFALLSALVRAQKAVARAARINEEFHFAGPLRVLGRITHQKPLALGGTLDGAIAFYERALQIAPHNSTTGIYFADALLADRQPKRAREALNAVIENSDPYNWAWETARDQKMAREWLQSRFD